MDAMHRQAVEYWVDQLEAAERVIREIALHPIDTQLAAAAAKQKAINYMILKGIEPASVFEQEEE